MGMYNEVYKSCPDCGHRCEIQIPQVVLGFGGFNLDYPQDIEISNLMGYQKDQLMDYVNEMTFYCYGCSGTFKVELCLKNVSKRIEI